MPFTILLIIAKSVSKIGSAKTSIGAINTTSVTVLATPRIEIVAKLNPKNCAPTSPINVLAGFRLNGKKPPIAPAKAVIKIIDINGESFVENIISKLMQDISDTPEDKPSNPSIKLIAFVIPTIQPIVSIKFKTG